MSQTLSTIALAVETEHQCTSFGTINASAIALG
jgi:hypothetical protein